jgi:hypothetical protein
MAKSVDISDALAESEGVETDDMEFATLEEGDTPESEFRDEEEVKESEEKEEEQEVEKEEEVEEESKKKAGESKAKVEERKLPQEVQNILAHLGKDETLKSKGLEVKASDFKPEEIKGFLNKGLRFYQAMDELSQRERVLFEREQATANAARQIQDLQTRLEQERRMRASQPATTLPRELEINEAEDSPELIALKKAAKSQWDRNQELSTRIDSIEGGFARQRTDEQEQALLNEIQSHKHDFPLASPEETIAVHLISKGSVPIRSIMQRGQQIYGSAKHVRDVFAACPEVRKEIFEEFVKEYKTRTSLAEKKRVPLRPSGPSTKPITTAKKKAPITFENVGSNIHKAIRERERIEEGEEL